jgi:hypothetical protein
MHRLVIGPLCQPGLQLDNAVLNQRDYNDRRAETDWEYAVGVDSKTQFRLSDAKTFRGVFANQNIVCRLSDPQTVRFVCQAFDIADRSVGS